MATMQKGEKALFKCKPSFAYGAQGNPPAIPESATLMFEVEMLGWKEKQKEKWEMSMEERLEEAKKRKDEGTGLFRERRFGEAAEVSL